MWRKNQFDLEPGPYEHVGTKAIVVVTEIVTHHYDGAEQKQLEDAWVVYRDLQPGQEKYITGSMLMNEFKMKFKSI